MSMWTYVRGLIEIGAPGRTQAEKDYILQTVIDHLPKVTGSEYGMNVYTIRANGHNSWSNHDELDHLKWGFKTQSKYFLVLDGSLRDRRYEETFKELNKFLNRLAKRLPVNSMHVQVYTYDHSHIHTFTNENDYYGKMFEIEHPWYKYLMWKLEDDD